jgi:hypothetical protein
VIQDWFVCVGESGSSLVGFNQIRELVCVDVVTDSWQVTGFVMSPELTCWQLAYLIQKRIKGKTASSIAYLSPVKGQGPVSAIADLFQWTGLRTGGSTGSADRNRSGLPVGRSSGEMKKLG